MFRRLTSVPLWAVAAVALCGLAAGAAAYWTMRTGVGLTNDSLSYLGLIDGLTLRAAGVHLGEADTLTRRFGPAMPALIAAIDSLLRFGPQRVARLLDVACLIVSTGLVATLVRAARPRRSEVWRAVLAGALFAASTDALNTHIHLWSEPTFGLWMLLGALTLTRYLRDGGRQWLIATALLAAAAVLTRYAGVALVGAEAVAVLLRAPRPRLRDRVAAAAFVVVVPMAAMLLWTLGVPQQGAGVGQRTITFALIPGARLDQCLQTLGAWVAWRGPWPWLARAGGVVAIATLILIYARPRRALSNPALALPFAYLVVYPLFLLVSITFVDPATPLDLRILAPLHAMAIVVGCATLGSRSLTTAIAAAALLVAQVASTGLYLSEVRNTGMGYASLRWRENQTVRAVANLPWQAPIFTTHHFALEAITSRNVYEIPTHPADAPTTVPTDLLVLPLFESIHAADGRGYFVYFKRPKPNKPFLSPSELSEYFKLQRIANLPDGLIYKIVAITRDLHPTATQPAARPRAADDPDAAPE